MLTFESQITIMLIHSQKKRNEFDDEKITHKTSEYLRVRRAVCDYINIHFHASSSQHNNIFRAMRLDETS